MGDKDRIAVIRDRARRNFSKGYNCSECVMEAVLESVDTGLPKETHKVATGFGGGVGLFGDTCGAITGAVTALGAVHGRSRLPKGENRKAVAKSATKQLYGNPGLYRLFNQLPNMVRNKYGETLCRDITAQWKDQWLCREHALHCREIITDTAEFAAELIYSEKDLVCSKPFSSNVENLEESAANCDPKG
jgi:C_GCAxxG_C_C family probable redox protein